MFQVYYIDINVIKIWLHSSKHRSPLIKWMALQAEEKKYFEESLKLMCILTRADEMIYWVLYTICKG